LILYFLRGSLPWQGLKVASQKQKEELILKMKEAIKIFAMVCLGNSRFIYLRKIFRDLFIREGFEYDQVFDWTILRYSMAMQGFDALA